MGFYASHSAYRLLVRAARFAEAKEAIRSILDGEGDEIAAQGRGADVLELDIDPRGALDEPWPEGARTAATSNGSTATSSSTSASRRPAARRPGGYPSPSPAGISPSAAYPHQRSGSRPARLWTQRSNGRAGRLLSFSGRYHRDTGHRETVAVRPR